MFISETVQDRGNPSKDARKLSTKSIQRKYQNEMTNKNTMYLPNKQKIENKVAEFLCELC